MGDREPGVHVPVGFEELTIGTPVPRQPRLPGCLRTRTVREIKAGLGVTVSATTCVLSLRLSSTRLKNPPPRPLEPGAHFSFELTGTRGAALVTKYKTYRQDSSLESEFEEYTKRHYDSWVEFARTKKYGNNVQPILVDGFDMTRDFAMVAYSEESTSLEADMSIDVPMLASLWGTWRTSCSPHTNYGPQECTLPPPGRTVDFPSQLVGTRSIPNEFDQCVFIRYYTMRPRKWFFPKVIRAGAGPHDLGSGDNRGDAFPELTVRHGTEPATDGDDDLGGRWDPVTDDTSSEPGIVVRNTPYVWFLQCPSVSVLIFAFRMRNMTAGTPLRIMYSR